MHTNLPAQSIAAIATLVAALITGAVSFVNLTLTKEQKVSEFRQAWIDSLRDDLASFLGAARAFSRAVEALHVYGPDYKEKGALLISDQKVGDLRYQAAETFSRIKLRLNATESEHVELLRLLRRAIDEQNTMLKNKSAADSTLEAIEAANEYARTVLKKEWERVKKGEFAFRVARNWIAPAIFLFSVAFVVLVWNGTIQL
jgi:hypothetical protein